MLENYNMILQFNIEFYSNSLITSEFIKPNIKINYISWTEKNPTIWNKVLEIFEEITEEELNKIYYQQEEITLINEQTKVEMTFKSTNGGFTIKELFDNILIFESKSRPLTKWLDNSIDIHNRCFEGLNLVDFNTFEINWSF